MKDYNKIILSFLLGLVCFGGYSQKYEIEFLAFNKGTSIPCSKNSVKKDCLSKWGHIFIVFYKNNSIEEALGFSNKGLLDEKYLIKSATYSFKIEVSQNNYNSAKSIHKTANDYIFGVFDCTSYASEVANKIDNLKTPSFSNCNFTPIGYIEDLIKKNKNYTYKPNNISNNTSNKQNTTSKGYDYRYKYGDKTFNKNSSNESEPCGHLNLTEDEALERALGKYQKLENGSYKCFSWDWETCSWRTWIQDCDCKRKNCY